MIPNVIRCDRERRYSIGCVSLSTDDQFAVVMCLIRTVYIL